MSFVQSRFVNRYSFLESRKDVDWVVVERLKAGTFFGDPTPAELREAILDLARYGMFKQDIARRIGCSDRTVQRHLAGDR